MTVGTVKKPLHVKAHLRSSPIQEAAIEDVVGTFAQDDRIVMWSLYNEPQNTKKGAQSLPLLREVFQ